MITRNFLGEEISLFGMGCMRLPRVNPEDDGSVDVEHATKMVEYAYKHGCNYFDTAWGYHNGISEPVIGKALSKYPRDSYHLATKFPGYASSNWPKSSEIFEQQLERCCVDFFDYYLIHNVCEMNVDAYLDDEKYGIRTYFTQQREAGKIKHLGFSVHGSYQTMRRFLEVWGNDVEFVQIQLNYIDYTFQDAKAKLELAAEYNLPVVVMEPLRGGMLAKATDDEASRLSALRPNEGIVGWALRYLQGFDQVKVILCGSSDLDQMVENMGYFENEQPLNDEENATLARIVNNRLSKDIPACTSCRYCVSHCPQEINIPWMIELFSEHSFTGGGFIAPMALMAVPEGKQPKDCIECGTCAEVCPQTIDIPAILKKFSGMLGF